MNPKLDTLTSFPSLKFCLALFQSELSPVIICYFAHSASDFLILVVFLFKLLETKLFQLFVSLDKQVYPKTKTFYIAITTIASWERIFLFPLPTNLFFDQIVHGRYSSLLDLSLNISV
jgi:hypothetical protein